MPENVDHPDHYGGDDLYEVIKVLEAWDLNLAKGFCWGNLIKYTARADKKGGVEDRLKAEWYANRLTTIDAQLAGREMTPSNYVTGDYNPATSSFPDYALRHTVLAFQPPGRGFQDDLGFRHVIAPDGSWWTQSKVNSCWFYGSEHVPNDIVAKATEAN